MRPGAAVARQGRAGTGNTVSRGCDLGAAARRQAAPRGRGGGGRPGPTARRRRRRPGRAEAPGCGDEATDAREKTGRRRRCAVKKKRMN
ncbi:hypothetical protein GQ55_4G005000 [Panicum hallii var. hallii]|uniref:Uncharacterized protein n=1 Tax=Panicum hallii var. hallii TaxID=1504633 RepID=A0A2T7DTS3_9POAL|nr:hypothetical protein GQ55_4G005000 [Panicum hallii var. hallii]